MLSQRERVKTWLEKHGKITKDEALFSLKVRNLPGRISELKRPPYRMEIVTVEKTGRNEYGSYHYLDHYALVKDLNPQPCHICGDIPSLCDHGNKGEGVDAQERMSNQIETELHRSAGQRAQAPQMESWPDGRAAYV